MNPKQPTSLKSSPLQRSQQNQFSKKLDNCTAAITRLTEAIESRRVPDELFDQMLSVFEYFNNRKVTRDKSSNAYKKEAESYRIKNNVSEKKHIKHPQNLEPIKDYEGAKNYSSSFRHKYDLFQQKHRKYESATDEAPKEKKAEEFKLDGIRIKSRNEEIKKKEWSEVKDSEASEDQVKETKSPQIKKNKNITESQNQGKIERLESSQIVKQEVIKENNSKMIEQSQAFPLITADFKDNIISVNMIDFDKIVSQSKKISLTCADNQSKPQQSFQQTILAQYKQSFKRWVADLYSTISKSSFYGFISKNMDKNTSKVYFSRNCIYNLIRMKEELQKRQQFGDKYVEELSRNFNTQSKESLKFLKLKYPQQEKVLFDGEIANMIPSQEVNDKHKYDIILKLSDGLKRPTWSKIKLFINQIIQQTNSKYSLFESHMKNLFQDIKNKDQQNSSSSFSYIIGTKIKVGTPKYTEQQLKQQGMNIKSGEIMRMIIKWINNLEDTINEEEKKITQLLQRQQKYLSPTISKHNKISVEQLEQRLKGSMSLNKSISKIFKIVLQNYEQMFQSVPIEEYKINIFSSIVSLGVQNVVSKYLYEILTSLSPPEISNRFKLPFQVFDLFRGKCSGSYKEIKQVYKNIKNSSIFEIIQVKNRINTPNRDYLLNMTMKGTDLVCQLQFHVDVGSKADEIKQHRSHCENDFNHFLYELQRSKFGPLAQMVSIYSLNSDLPAYFSVDKLNKFRKQMKKNSQTLKISVSQPDYKLKLYSSGQECEQMKNKQNEIFVICNYCFRMSHNDSIKYWKQTVTKQNICEICVIEEMSVEDKMKLFFKEYVSEFKHLEMIKHNNDWRFVKFFVIMDKNSLKLEKFKRNVDSQEPYYTKINSIQRMDEQAFYDKYLTSNHFIFTYGYQFTEDEQLTQVTLTHQSPIFSSISKQDLNLYNFPLLLTPGTTVRIQYIHKSPAPIYILSITILDFYQSQEASKLHEQVVFNKRDTLELDDNFTDYRIFKHIPLHLQKNILNLKITEDLQNFPVLDTMSISKVEMAIKCNIKRLEFGNLKMNNIRELMVRLREAEDQHEGEDIFNFGMFKSPNVVKLSLQFFEYKNLKIVYGEDGINGQKNSNGKMENSLPSLKQLQLQLESLQDKKSQSQISFKNIIHHKLQVLKVKTKHRTIFDLTNSTLPQLHTLEYQYQNPTLLLSQQLQQKPEQLQQERVELRGFNFPTYIFGKLHSVVLLKITHTSLQYLPINQLKRFECQLFSSSSSESMSKSVTKEPIQNFINLQALVIKPKSYFLNKIKRLDNLVSLDVAVAEIKNDNFECEEERKEEKIIKVEGEEMKVVEFKVLRQLYSFGLQNLKTLSISINQNSTHSKFSTYHTLHLTQSFPYLKFLQIFDYNQIIIGSSLPSLQTLSLSSNLIDIRSISSTKLTELKLTEENDMKLKKIKLDPLQAAYLENLELEKKEYIECFEGVKLVKNYFWNLKTIRAYDRERLNTAQIKNWERMNVEDQQEIKAIVLKRKIGA